MPTLRDFAVFIFGCLAYAVMSTITRNHGVPFTAIGRAKARGEKAFVLSVTLDFQDEETATGLVEAWREAADWCYLNENFLYACECCRRELRATPWHTHPHLSLLLTSSQFAIFDPSRDADEIAKSDKNPLHYNIIERYRSKADYTGAHRSSPAFHKFRPKMKALQEAGKVQVGGNSYVELGVGFV